MLQKYPPSVSVVFPYREIKIGPLLCHKAKKEKEKKNSYYYSYNFSEFLSFLFGDSCKPVTEIHYF